MTFCHFFHEKCFSGSEIQSHFTLGLKISISGDISGEYADKEPASPPVCVMSSEELVVKGGDVELLQKHSFFFFTASHVDSSRKSLPVRLKVMAVTTVGGISF